MLNAVETARLTAIQTEVATGNVANLAEMQALLAKQVAAPLAPVTGNL